MIHEEQFFVTIGRMQKHCGLGPAGVHHHDWIGLKTLITTAIQCDSTAQPPCFGLLAHAEEILSRPLASPEATLSVTWCLSSISLAFSAALLTPAETLSMMPYFSFTSFAFETA